MYLFCSPQNTLLKLNIFCPAALKSEDEEEGYRKVLSIHNSVGGREGHSKEERERKEGEKVAPAIGSCFSSLISCGCHISFLCYVIFF